MVAELKTQMQEALADIRRIAYDLRPPALDELGLVGALKEHIASYNQVQGLQIMLEAPESSPSLPAAVEVAAYRIALEAMTNVSRHAGARHCLVRLSLMGDLCLEVTDDGRRLPTAVRAGLGLTSMRERAVGELGFYLDIERTAAVVVDQPSVIYSLSRPELAAIEKIDPETANLFHRIVMPTCCP
jgi:signal transduction histidine kinase